MMSVRVWNREKFPDTGGLDLAGHLFAALGVKPKDVVGNENVRSRDRLQFLDHSRRGFLVKRALAEFPD